MSLKDWIIESKTRFSELPPHQALAESVDEFVMGAKWRFGAYVGNPIWQHGDFDVLVILDACRYDMMVDVYPEYGSECVDWRLSNASCSTDWIRRNITTRPDRQPNLAYVTANPFADNDTSPDSNDLGAANLGHFRPLYKTDWEQLCDGQIATVPPKTVTDHAIDVWRNREKHDIDTMIVHYMQPHEPYITHPEWGSGDSKLLSNLIDENNPAGDSVWPKVENGEIPLGEFYQANLDNLRWVLEFVIHDLCKNIDAKVVLSADHGNAFGEWGEWHHPRGAMCPAVRRVPWVEIEAEDMGTVHPDVEFSLEKTTDTTTDDQLRALGYK